jgi:Glycosyl transferase family 2
MEQVASKAPPRSLLGTILRVWREEGWPGVRWRLQARLGWLGLHPRAPRLPPLRRPEWLEIAGSRETFAREIALPAIREPLVSVVIHDRDEVEGTLCSVAAMVRHRPEVSLEVIVAVDGSHHDSSRLLPLVENLVCSRREGGDGFAASRNQAARAARGRFLLFVDPRAQVQPGWLDELVAAFDDPKVGIAGSKVISRTGRLEEA